MPHSSFAFTITTKPATKTIYNPSHPISLQRADFFAKIDSTALAKTYPCHNGIYYIYPYELIPFINESITGGDLTLLQKDRPKVSFEVKYFDRGTTSYTLDCLHGIGSISFHKAGETQRCDGGPKANNCGKDGRIEYRINNIKQPTMLETTAADKSFRYVWKDTQNPEIVIDFDVRFRIDEGTGAGGTFTPWFSTQEQINAYATGLPKKPGDTGPTGDTNGPTQPPQKPEVVLPTDCSSCASIIQCLACLQYNFVSSLKRVW
ncbi:MAG: hypothetical protein N3F05_04720 [Candidatus Diapherotrites archaeon]|nr:hypothetical protein [Candidatus Diapherotrites archaeon]